MRSASSTLFSDKKNPGSHEYSAKNGIVINFVEEQGMAIIRQKLKNTDLSKKTGTAFHAIPVLLL